MGSGSFAQFIGSGWSLAPYRTTMHTAACYFMWRGAKSKQWHFFILLI